MGERVEDGVLKKCYTVSKLLYGAKEEAVSGLCLHCVCDELATVDHFAMTSLFVGRLST